MINKTFEDVFSIEALKKNIKSALEELVISGEDTSRVVATLSSGQNGQYIPQQVSEMFGEDELCRDNNSVWYWDEWADLEVNLNTLLEEARDKFNLLEGSPFSTAYLCMYTDENDGSFILGVEIPSDTWDFYFTCDECGELHEVSEDNLCYHFKDKKYCKEDYENKCLEYYTNACTVGGGFFTKLCDALKESDSGNEERLHKAFPELVDGYCMWKYRKLKY